MPQPYYADEHVTLYHGDCRDIMPTLVPVDVVLTDAPYGVSYISNWTTGRGATPITNDGARLSVALMRQVIPLLRAQHVLWFTRWDVWPDVWQELGMWFPLRGLLVWDKGHPGMGDLTHWGPSYELIASAGSGACRGSRDGSILRYNAPAATNRVHPTEKPQALLAYLLGKLGAQTVLDPFAGGGSTLLAARLLGAQSIGIEVDERYCDLIARRMSQGVLTEIAASTGGSDTTGGDHGNPAR